MVRGKRPLIVKNPCTLLNGLSCRSCSGSLQDWNWFSGMGLEEISSSSPRDISAILYSPHISLFPSMLIQKKPKNYTLTQAYLIIYSW